MSNRTAYAGLAADGDVYTAANHARMPGGWIGRVTATADQTVTNAILAILAQAVTVNPSRLIRVSTLVSLTLFNLSGGDAIGTGHVRILQDGVVVHTARWTGDKASANLRETPVEVWALLTPSAGAHTYSVEIRSLDSTTRVELKASAGTPATLLIEDIGPAS